MFLQHYCNVIVTFRANPEGITDSEPDSPLLIAMRYQVSHFHHHHHQVSHSHHHSQEIITILITVFITISPLKMHLHL